MTAALFAASIILWIWSWLLRRSAKGWAASYTKKTAELIEFAKKVDEEEHMMQMMHIELEEAVKTMERRMGI